MDCDEDDGAASLFVVDLSGVGTPAREQLLEVARELAVEEHLFACHGMDEAQGLGVKRLAWAQCEAVLDKLLVARELISPQDLVASVACVSEERVPDVAHVGADLVRASCLESAFDPADVS